MANRNGKGYLSAHASLRGEWFVIATRITAEPNGKITDSFLREWIRSIRQFPVRIRASISMNPNDPMR
jgi:hypothetical protein